MRANRGRGRERRTFGVKLVVQGAADGAQLFENHAVNVRVASGRVLALALGPQAVHEVGHAPEDCLLSVDGRHLVPRVLVDGVQLLK